MRNQKIKNTGHNKKGTEGETVPIRSLMQEIGQLREELRGFKHGKRQQEHISNGPFNPKMNKQNQQNHPIQFNVEYLSRQAQIKMQLEIGKLRRAVISNDEEKVGKTLNEIFQLFNHRIKETIDEKDRTKLQFEDLISIYTSYQKDQQEKYKIVIKNNKKLEQQIEELKKNVLNLIDQQQGKDQQTKSQNLLLKNQIQTLKNERQELTKNNEELESIIEEWEMQCRIFKEKCSNYQSNLENKAEQLIFMEEDVKYLRLQSQKFKSQKKQIEKLWEKSSQELKDLKKSFDQELNKAQRQKNKWMNECALRRQQSQQIQSIQGHKELLFKEIQQLRQSYSLKCKEVAEIKSLLHESQRKIISLQSENYTMAQQREASKRQTEYWEAQIEILKREVHSIQQLKDKSQMERKAKNISFTLDQSQKKMRDEKLKALQDIHNLIRQHKNQVDQDE